MKKQNFCTILMALVAMSFFRTLPSYAQADQTKAFTPKIKTPNTSSELTDKSQPAKSTESEDTHRETSQTKIHTAAPRRLQQHGLGFGVGQTFLMGDYSKYGDNKITLDLLYSYAASYSFDLLINAHISEHKSETERMKLLGLSSSIKGRFVEYDNLSPYFLGGLGFYAPQAKRRVNGSLKTSEQKLTFGLNFGGGVDLRLNEHYVVGVMAQLHWPFKVQQDNQSDLKGYYTKLLITGMYLF